MTNFHLKPLTSLPSLAVQEAKEQRRKQLEAARNVSRGNYKRFRERMQEQEKRVDPYQAA